MIVPPYGRVKTAGSAGAEGLISPDLLTPLTPIPRTSNPIPEKIQKI